MQCLNQRRLLTVVVHGLPNAAISSFLFTEAAFYVERFLRPRITVEQNPNVLIMTLVDGIDGG